MAGRSSLSIIIMCIFMEAALATSIPVKVLRAHHHPILVSIKGRDGYEAILASRRHDVAPAGFANGSRHWFAFPGNEHLLPTPCTTLPFGNSYEDLIGGLHNLPGLPVGNEPTLEAVEVLSTTHDLAGDDNNVPLKRALASLKVVTTESVRLKPIRAAVSEGWERGTSVAAEHLPYIEHWDTMLYEVILANRSGTGRWLGPFNELLRKRAGIHSLEEALAVVDVVVDRSMQDLVEAHVRKAW